MITMNEMIEGVSSIDETELVKISDKLWKIGNLDEIKETVSPDLFYLHISINMIGNWQCDGWWFLICEGADLVPYISTALDKLNLPELKKAFENVINLFPEYTVFKSDDAAYYDICNFLQNAHIKVDDERLKCIPSEKRKEMVRQVEQNMDILEDLTDALWGYGAECGGWKQVLDYIYSNIS